MTTQIKRRRGTTAEHASFTGAEGELTIDTTKDTVVVHDGTTAGGHPLFKESGGTVTGNVDVTGTVTADGLTVEAGIAQLELIDTNVSGSTKLRTADAQTWLEIDPDNLQGSSGFATYIDGKQLFKIADTGDISFYEPTGATPKFFWDASAESLGIGTTTPLASASITTQAQNTTSLPGMAMRDDTAANTSYVFVGASSHPVPAYRGHLNLSSANDVRLYVNSGTSPSMTVASSGNVGIGEVSPSSYGKLTVLDGATRFWIKQDTSNEMMLSVGASERMLFGINNAEAMRIDAAGNVLMGATSSPVTLATTGSVKGFGYDAALGFAVVSRASDSPLIVNRLTDDGSIISMRKNGTVVGSIAAYSPDTLSIYSGDVGLAFGPEIDAIFPVGSAVTSRDNAIDLGRTNVRFDDIYATNGTIQTSDQNEKQQIASLTTAEMDAAKAISQLFKTFKWNDSVADKGDAARTHTGVIAQDVETALTDAGLDAGDYAFFISDTWWETQTDVPAVAAVDEVLDDDGNVVTEAVEAKAAYTRTDTYHTLEEAPEGATERTRKGIRYPQLLSFVGAATEQRLADIETRLTALEGA